MARWRRRRAPPLAALPGPWASHPPPPPSWAPCPAAPAGAAWTPATAAAAPMAGGGRLTAAAAGGTPSRCQRGLSGTRAWWFPAKRRCAALHAVSTMVIVLVVTAAASCGMQVRCAAAARCGSWHRFGGHHWTGAATSSHARPLAAAAAAAAAVKAAARLQLCSIPNTSATALARPQFGFIKCSTHEGRYFFHVNDTDGQAAYGSTVRCAASCWACCPR